MKRFIVFFSLSFLFFSLHASAAQYTFSNTKSHVTITLDVQATFATIKITHTGPATETIKGPLAVWAPLAPNKAYQDPLFYADININETTAQTVIGRANGLLPDKSYKLTFLNPDGYDFKTEKTDTCSPADTNPISGVEKLGIAYEDGYIVLSNKFNEDTHPCFQSFKASIEIFKEDPAANPSAARVFYTKSVKDKEKRAEGINSNGEFYYYIANIDPNTTYYYKQTISDQSTDGKTVSSTGSFPSTKGYTPVGSTQQSFEEHSYRLLAPFPGFTVLMDPELCAVQKAQHKIAPDAVCDVNDLLNFAFRLLIGVAAALLIFRIMLAGYQYITTDVPFLKNNAKTHIAQSALGILLALSAYLILNTINPKLVNNQFKLNAVQVGVEVINLPDAGDDLVDPDFSKNNFTYSKDASISPEVTNVVNKIKNEGWAIDSFKIYTNDRMLIYLKKGTQTDNTNIINIGHGLKGFSQQGQGTTGDKKTPMGNWKILEVRKSANPGQPVYNAQGANMGAAFFLLSPTTNGERGIGMHGNKTGTITATNGCIRLKNADIEALLPYIKVGTPVIIGN